MKTFIAALFLILAPTSALADFADNVDHPSVIAPDTKYSLEDYMRERAKLVCAPKTVSKICTSFSCPDFYAVAARVESCKTHLGGLISASAEETAQCLIGFANERREPGVIDAILSNLEKNTVEKPWTSQVLRALFPMLKNENPEFRRMFSQWHRVHALSQKRKPVELFEIVNGPEGDRLGAVKDPVPVTGIVQVSSVYKDEKNGALVTEIGTGTLVAAGHRNFVLTAAHLVGGKNLRIRVGADLHDLQTRAVLTDDDNDVAWIEVPRQKNAALTYSPRDRKFYVADRLEQGFYKGDRPWLNIAIDSRTMGIRPSPVTCANGEISNFTPADLLYFLATPWAIPGFDGFDFGFNTEDLSRRGVGVTVSGEQIRVRARVYGGTSGSFVAQMVGRPYLDGVITQSNYYFNETFLARAHVVLRAFDGILAGKRGNLSVTRWKMRGGLTYREFGGGWLEASFIRANTGKGSVGDPGKGSVGDPGKGSVGDPGKGSVGDPGKGSVGDPGKGSVGDPGKGSVGDPGKGSVGDPGGARSSNEDSFSPWRSASPLEVFNRYELEPGLSLNGQAIVAIRGTAKTKGVRPNRLLMYADQEALRFMAKHRDHYRFEPVAAGTELLKEVRERFQGIKSFRPLTGAPRNLETYMTNFDFAYDESSIELSNDGLRVSIYTHAKEFDKKTKLDTRDRLDFTLDEKGALKGQRFLPIIEVRGKISGELYYVDVRRLLFTDVSQVSLGVHKSLSKEEVRRQIGLFGVTARNARSRLEFGFTFAPNAR